MGPDHQWWKHQKPVHEQRTGDGQSESLEEAVEHLWSGILTLSTLAKHFLKFACS